MSTRRVFWTLVHNDYRHGSAFKLEGNTKWKIFALAALLMGFGLYTSNLFAEWFIVVLYYLIATTGFIIFFLTYIPFLLNIDMLPREWKNGTEGWWLSLPYSRKLLLAAKSMASIFQFIKLLLFFVITTVFLTILTKNLQPDVRNIALLHDLPQSILFRSAIAILISPFFVIFGITLSVLGKSKMKVLVLPVLLTALILAAIGGFLLIYPLYALFSPDSFRSPAWLSLLLIFGFSMGLSALLFFFAAYVLEYKIDL